MPSSRCLRRLAAFVVLVTTIGIAPLAFAQAADRAEHAPLLALDWNADANCPSGSAFQHRVRALAGNESDGGEPLRVRASIVREDRRYVLSLIVEDRAPRRLVNDDCRRLTEAAAVIVALDLEAHQRAAQETRVAREVAPSPSTPADTAPEPHVAQPAPAPRALVVVKRKVEPKTEPVPLRVGVEVEHVFDIGSLPSATSGLRAGFHLERGPWSAALDGTLLVPRDAVGTRPNAGAEVRLVFGSVRACGGVPTGQGRLVWRACLGGEAGQSRVEGYGISRPLSSSGLWLAASLSPELELRLSPGIALVAGLEGVAPIRASKITVDGAGTLFDPPPAVFRATLGLRFTFFRSRR